MSSERLLQVYRGLVLPCEGHCLVRSAPHRDVRSPHTTGSSFLYERLFSLSLFFFNEHILLRGGASLYFTDICLLLDNFVSLRASCCGWARWPSPATGVPVSRIGGFTICNVPSTARLWMSLSCDIPPASHTPSSCNKKVSPHSKNGHFFFYIFPIRTDLDVRPWLVPFY